jgi:hypothetical protein
VKRPRAFSKLSKRDWPFIREGSSRAASRQFHHEPVWAAEARPQ